MSKNEQTEATSIRVNRNKIDSLDVFDVTKDELEQLKSGGPVSTVLNFAIATGSFGASSLLSLINLDAGSDREYLSFLCATIIALLACIILLVIWWQIRGKREKIFQRINDRSNGSADDSNSDQTSIDT